MKTAVHYAMTLEGDEVWLILTTGEFQEVCDCLELATLGRLQKTPGNLGGPESNIIAVFSRTALRAANRFIAEKVERCGGARACPLILKELHSKLRYEADRLRRAELTPESVFVAEARAGLPLRQEA